MAAVTGLTTIKKFTYRGDPNEEFSSKYFFAGAPPGDDPSWFQLMNDVWNHEKLLFSPQVHLVRVYGYNSDDPNAAHVYVNDLEAGSGALPGTRVGAAGQLMAGDQAACIVWTTSRLNSRGKRIYLRKYIHEGLVDLGNPDNLSPDYYTLVTTFASLTAGINLVHGGLRSQSHAENLTGGGALPHVTTRTLKRRGKRPKTGS